MASPDGFVDGFVTKCLKQIRAWRIEKLDVTNSLEGIWDIDWSRYHGLNLARRQCAFVYQSPRKYEVL